MSLAPPSAQGSGGNPSALQSEIARLQQENAALRQRTCEVMEYLRRKVSRLFAIDGSVPLPYAELSDAELVTSDPLGIISDRIAQILQTLHTTNEELRSARDEISAIYNGVGAGIVVLDRERRIVSFNRRQKELFFSRRRRIVGRTCLSLLCRDKVPAPGCVFAKVMASGESEWTKEWVFKQRYYDVVGVPVKDLQGEVQQVVIVYHEVTERKQGEEELRRALARTVEAQENVEAIVTSVHEGMLVTDAAGRLLLVNPAALRMLQRSEQEVIGQSVHQLCPDGEMATRWEAAMQSNEAGPPFDCCLGGDAAHPCCYQARMALLHASDNTLRGAVVTLRDVTSDRELERMKSEFVATAAHELRTPLTSILGFSELLKDPQAFSNRERHEFVALIHDKALKLSALIDELLDISRIEAGEEIRLERQALSLGSLIEASLNFFRHSSPGHQFTLLMPPLPVIVYADQRRIGQVLDNLLSNAVKYSPAGGSITVRLAPAGADCKVSISDEGIGMTAEQAARIFDKFYRADASATAVQGAGLGMTIVKELVERHGSAIAVESTPGKGTTISFTLPLAAGSEWGSPR